MSRREFSQAEKDQFSAERREQLEMWQSQVAGKVTDLVNGDEWQRWLDVAARFHRYSFNNSVLILLQRPDATAVAGYQAWKTSFGRQVNKGETGIRILAPVTTRASRLELDGSPLLDESGKPATGRQLVGVKVVSVFDVSQTTGPDLPVMPRPELLAGQAPDGLWDRLQSFVEAQGFRVERGDCGTANGFTDFTAAVVRVRSDVDDAQAVTTLAHEAGHVLLHAPEGRRGEPVCRGRSEVEAESVAYLVTAAHGLNSGQYTFCYVAGWAESAQATAREGTTLADVISATGSRVISSADTILAATQPPAVAVQVVDAMATSLDRTVAVDRSFTIGQLSTRPLAPAKPTVTATRPLTVAPAR